MFLLNRGRMTILATIIAIAAQFSEISEPLAQGQAVSIFVVRHAEIDRSKPTLPLTAAGHQRQPCSARLFEM